MSIGNWASCAPSATSAAAAPIASATSASSRPSSAFVSAAASLIRASARMKRRGNRWPEIGKLRTARCVDAPYSASAGTSISPIESRSIRVAPPVDRSSCTAIVGGVRGRTPPGALRRRPATR